MIQSASSKVLSIPTEIGMLTSLDLLDLCECQDSFFPDPFSLVDSYGEYVI